MAGFGTNTKLPVRPRQCAHQDSNFGRPGRRGRWFHQHRSGDHVVPLSRLSTCAHRYDQYSAPSEVDIVRRDPAREQQPQYDRSQPRASGDTISRPA
jgi:hypothetical protein